MVLEMGGQNRWKVAIALVSMGGLIACTTPGEAPAPEAPEESISADPATLLPALSPQVLQQRETELTERIQSEYDLAGLGKTIDPGEPFSPELEQFRLAIAETNSAVAPFLGTWIRDWGLMPYDFTTVLPSTVLGQVCLVRYRQMETETVPFETVTTPPEFSVGLVVDGQLLSRDMQTAASLLRRVPANEYVPYEVEFLATVEADGQLRLLASQRPPALDPEWDSSLVSQLQTYGCATAAAL